MKTAFLLAPACFLLASCGSAFPLPFPQRAPIPAFVGRVEGRQLVGSAIQVENHPETATATDGEGQFRTLEGCDFYFGMEQSFFPRSYRLIATRHGEILKSWEVERPGLLGHYPGQPFHSRGIDVGNLR